MLDTQDVETILNRIPRARIGLIGDLFLDRYLMLDDALTEPSIETGLPAYQVTQIHSYPGALGTILNNLLALGVGELVPITMIGDDGEGYELMQVLRKDSRIKLDWIIQESSRRTPTYTKPMLLRSGEIPRELNRLDIKNRQPLPKSVEMKLLDALDSGFEHFDALLILDQVSEENCGTITTNVRNYLSALGQRLPQRFALADSRERIHLFRNVCVKPNEREVALARSQHALHHWNRTIFATQGERGIELIEPGKEAKLIPGYPVTGPTDIVGAGDSCSAGIACAIVAGLNHLQAASFGNLVASITVQKIGTTGTATPEEVRDRWKQVTTESESR